MTGVQTCALPISDLAANITVVLPDQAKGLEFDAVVVLDPAAILAASGRGTSDLYVALTRATARLGVVHPGDLPPVLARLAPVTLEELAAPAR